MVRCGTTQKKQGHQKKNSIKGKHINRHLFHHRQISTPEEIADSGESDDSESSDNEMKMVEEDTREHENSQSDNM